jgi:endonuclease G, mitochondrial
MTKEITECYRGINELLIIDGVLWGNNPNDDFFTEPHGVKTPDTFWKVIIRNDRPIAWIITNSMDACSDQVNPATVLETRSYFASTLFGGKPPLC